MGNDKLQNRFHPNFVKRAETWTKIPREIMNSVNFLAVSDTQRMIPRATMSDSDDEPIFLSVSLQKRKIEDQEKAKAVAIAISSFLLDENEEKLRRRAEYKKRMVQAHIAEGREVAHTSSGAHMGEVEPTQPAEGPQPHVNRVVHMVYNPSREGTGEEGDGVGSRRDEPGTPQAIPGTREGGASTTSAPEGPQPHGDRVVHPVYNPPGQCVRGEETKRRASADGGRPARPPRGTQGLKARTGAPPGGPPIHGTRGVRTMYTLGIPNMGMGEGEVKSDARAQPGGGAPELRGSTPHLPTGGRSHWWDGVADGWHAWSAHPPVA